MLTVPAALIVGWLMGYLARWMQTRKVRGPRIIEKHEIVVPGISSANAVIAEEWRLALSAFTLWAERTGLSECAVANAGVTSPRGYRKLVGVLKDNGIMVATERSRTRYAPGFSGPLVRSWLRRRKLALRLPPSPPPEVHVPKFVREPMAVVADGSRWTQMVDVREDL